MNAWRATLPARARARAAFRESLLASNGRGASVNALAANAFILALNTATGVVTARALGAAGRGELIAMAVGPQFLTAALSLGLPSSLLYNLKRDPASGRALLTAALLLATAVSASIAALGAFCIPYWLAGHPAEIVRFARVAMLASPLTLLGLVVCAALQARERFLIYNAVRVAMPLVTLAALATLAAVGAIDPYSATLCYLIGGVPALLVGFACLAGDLRPTAHGLAAASRSLLGYGARACGMDLLAALHSGLDQLLIVGFLPSSATGLYAVAFSLSRVLNVGQTAAVSVLFPKAAGRSATDASALAGRVARTTTAAALIGAVALFVVGPALLRSVYGPEFVAAGTTLRILAAEAVLGGANWVLAQAFLALGRPEIITVQQAGGVLLRLGLFFVLVPALGIDGAALALLLATTTRFVLVVMSFPFVLGIPAPRLWPRPSDLVRVGGAPAAAAERAP